MFYLITSDILKHVWNMLTEGCLSSELDSNVETSQTVDPSGFASHIVLVVLFRLLFCPLPVNLLTCCSMNLWLLLWDKTVRKEEFSVEHELHLRVRAHYLCNLNTPNRFVRVFGLSFTNSWWIRLMMLFHLTDPVQLNLLMVPDHLFSITTSPGHAWNLHSCCDNLCVTQTHEQCSA